MLLCAGRQPPSSLMCLHKEAGAWHASSMMQQPRWGTWPVLLIKPHTLQLAGAWLLQRVCKQREASHAMRRYACKLQ